MPQYIIPTAERGAATARGTAHISVNGAPDRTVPIGTAFDATAAEVEALEHAGYTVTPQWRSLGNAAMDDLTIDTDEVDDDAAAATVIGTLSGMIADSTLSLADTFDDQFALDGADLVVGAGELVADEYEVEVIETNAEIENSPHTTTLTITVNVAA